MSSCIELTNRSRKKRLRFELEILIGGVDRDQIVEVLRNAKNADGYLYDCIKDLADIIEKG